MEPVSDEGKCRKFLPFKKRACGARNLRIDASLFGHLDWVFLNRALVGRLRKLFFKILTLGTKGRLAHIHDIMSEIAMLSSVQYESYKKRFERTLSHKF